MSALKPLRKKGYDDSRSSSKADEQRRKNLRAVHALIKYIFGEVFFLPVTENGLSGDKDSTRWTVEEDSSIMTTKKDTYKLKFLLNGYPIFLIFIIGCIFSVFKSYHLKIRGLTEAGR